MPIRALATDDRPLLREATLANMNWSGQRFTLADVDASKELSHYFDGFPGERDLGFAMHEGRDVQAVAWLVFLPEHDPGYGFVSADFPELSITTFEPFQGRGFGSALLDHLIAEARTVRIAAISLSVEDGNRARNLYERVGFEVVGRSGGSDTMLLSLA